MMTAATSGGRDRVTDAPPGHPVVLREALGHNHPWPCSIERKWAGRDSTIEFIPFLNAIDQEPEVVTFTKSDDTFPIRTSCGSASRISDTCDGAEFGVSLNCGFEMIEIACEPTRLQDERDYDRIRTGDAN